MASLSGVSTAGVNVVNTTNTGTALTAISRTNDAALQTAAIQSSVVNTLVTLGSSRNTALTYNASGLLNTYPQVSSATQEPTTVQAAQDALLATQNVISQTLSSLSSAASANTATSGFTSLLGSNGTLATYNSSGLVQASFPNSTVTGQVDAQSAQNAVLQAQYSVTQAMGSLAAGVLPNQPVSRR